MDDFSEAFTRLDDSALLNLRVEMRAELQRCRRPHPATPH
jgi:hypothetical protein